MLMSFDLPNYGVNFAKYSYPFSTLVTTVGYLHDFSWFLVAKVVASNHHTGIAKLSSKPNEVANMMGGGARIDGSGILLNQRKMEAHEKS